MRMRWRRSLLRKLSGLSRVWRWESWSVRLFVRALATSFLSRVRCSSGLRRCYMSRGRPLRDMTWRHRVDRWTLGVTLGRRVGVLRRRIGVASRVLLRRKRLTISSVELLWRCTLLSPDSMRRDEGL
jgi:hypothetical protein